jgi:hypothetical protein
VDDASGVDRRSPQAAWELGLGVGGLLLHLGVGVFPYLASGLLVPMAGLVVLLVVWLAGLAVAVVLWRRSPRWVPVVPLAALGFWWALVSVGEAVWGWAP